MDKQVGMEPTPDAYVVRLVEVFGEVRRVLRDDGTVWINLGDAYYGTGSQGGGNRQGYKPKDLLGIPWRTALALQADGWYLRADIVWAKTAPLPEHVSDRPTRAHEYLFLLSQRPQYYYDAGAIAEDAVTQPGKRNKRSVWVLGPEPQRGAHYATMPTKLVEPCILAGSAPGDTVLDPFCGSGTVGVVAVRHGRSFIGIDLRADYVEMARGRIAAVQPALFEGEDA